MATGKKRLRFKVELTGPSKGGLARKNALTPEERSDIARKGAEERWARLRGLPKETHPGVLRIGTIELPCAVLEGGVRVLPRQGLRLAFGVKSRSRSAGSVEDANLPAFLASGAFAPHLSDRLRKAFAGSIAYQPKAGNGGSMGYAYRAEILPMVCEALIDAAADPSAKLQASQRRMAEAARILHRALAMTGVVALIDEATGYQYERPSDDLQRLIAVYVVEQMRPWVGLFPNMFFRGIYKLYGWQYEEGTTQSPRYVGKFINKYVYEMLPRAVVEELRSRNPAVDGRRKHKHHQFLTETVGVPALDRHLASLCTLMALSANKEHFDQLFRQAFAGQLALPGVVAARPDDTPAPPPSSW